jgi:hypothetical protein
MKVSILCPECGKVHEFDVSVEINKRLVKVAGNIREKITLESVTANASKVMP